MIKKELLNNVLIIRPILILLVVFYHAFAIYNKDAWAPLNGFPEIRTYWWLDKLSYAFMLEGFVFVSGYVFGFQMRTKGRWKLGAKQLLWGKFKRLMIPCMLFSFLYIALFGNISQPIQYTLYGLISGYAHMWFLPMLFWCFVGVFVIEKLKVKRKCVLFTLILASSIVPTNIPFQIGTAVYYMLFFCVGYIIQRDNYLFHEMYCGKYVLVLVASFTILFPLLTLVRDNVSMLSGGGYFCVNNFCDRWKNLQDSLLFYRYRDDVYLCRSIFKRQN